MANPEHVAKLEEGVQAWNAWREGNPGVRPDLSSASLSEANLVDANLRGAQLEFADLDGAQLRGADLSGAYLNEAHLAGASLAKANLSGAELTDADLSAANLAGADLSGADLSEADLTEADVNGADLSDANLEKANLSSADLSGANLAGARLADANWLAADLSGANLSEADLSYTYWLGVFTCGARFDGARLCGFRTAKCDFTDATCTRADYADWEDDGPKWREFAPGEFAKLYNDALAVEMLFERRVPLGAVLQVVGSLGTTWLQEHPDNPVVPQAIEFRANEIAVKLGVAPEDVVALAECCEGVLRRAVDAFGLDEKMVPWVASGLAVEIAKLQPRDALGHEVKVNIIQGDQVQTKVVGNPYHSETHIGKIEAPGGIVNIADVISGQAIQSGTAGEDIARALQQAHEAGQLEARVREIEAAFAALLAADKDALLKQTKAAISPGMWEFLRGAVASVTGGLFIEGLKARLGL